MCARCAEAEGLKFLFAGATEVVKLDTRPFGAIPPAAVKTGFIDKLISRLGRVGPEEARRHLLRVVREKGFLETIFNAIQEGIVVTDPRGRIVYLNGAATEFFGLDAQNLPRQTPRRTGSRPRLARAHRRR